MSRGSIKNWDRERGEPLFARIGGSLHHGVSGKEMVDHAIYRLRAQQNRLEGASMRMQQHDRDIFGKCVRAQEAKDHDRAAMYANECAEVRKMAKITLQGQLALEQVTLRLETVREFGDIGAMMGPVASVVRTIKNQVAGVIPEVGFELGEIGEMLNGMVTDLGDAPGSAYGYEASSEGAQKILGEANAIAEQRMKERFPDLPTSPVPTAQPSTETTWSH